MANSVLDYIKKEAKPLGKLAKFALHSFGFYAGAATVAEAAKRTPHASVNFLGASLTAPLELLWYVPMGFKVGGFAGLALDMALKMAIIMPTEIAIGALQDGMSAMIERGATLNGWRKSQVVYNEQVSSQVSRAVNQMEGMGMGYQSGIQNRAFLAHKRLTTRL